MLISKSCIYGVRSVLYLALQEDRSYVSIREISKKLNISFHYLTKILQTLNRTGIVNSTKGPKGGISFKIPPEKLTVFDVVDAIDSDEVFRECVLGLPDCSDENPCALHKIFYRRKASLQNELKEVTIREIAAEITEKKVRLYEVIK